VSFLPELLSIPRDECAYWDTARFSHRYHERIDAFQRPCYDNGLVQSFPWTLWSDECERYEADAELVALADLETCIKLITAHIRAERFADGHLAAVFRSGHIFAVLRRLKQLGDALQK